MNETNEDKIKFLISQSIAEIKTYLVLYGLLQMLICIILCVTLCIILCIILAYYFRQNIVEILINARKNKWVEVFQETDSISNMTTVEEIAHDTERGPSGLKNKSSTCYMNAMVQAAASSNILIEQVKAQEQHFSLFKFVNLLSELNKSGNKEETIERNTKLLEELTASVSWNKLSQQDSFDLFSALVAGMNSGLTKLGEFQMPMKLKLVHRFKGMGIPDKVQDHLGLSVGLCGDYSKTPGESLEYLIKQHFSPTIIDDDPDKTTQMFFYQQAPDVLLIHIQANKWDYERGEMYKPEYYVTYDEKMELDVEIIRMEENKPINETVNYELIAVTKHIGSISGGHYVTYRKYKDQWYLANDEQVDKTNFDKNIVPYIMIYEKSRHEDESPTSSWIENLENITNFINIFDKG